jgi:hypothetical protein
MKIRNGFVSNSSSSSFLIPINALKNNQIRMIQSHIDVAKEWSKYQDEKKKIYCEDSDKWDIEVTDKCVYGYTFMDNFDMRFFLEEIMKIGEKYTYWGENSLDLDELNREILQEERKEKLDNLENYEN